MSLKRSNKFALAILVILIGGFLTWKYVIYKPHADIEAQQAVFDGTITDFKKQLTNNVAQWTNKIVKLRGKVTTKDKQGLLMDENVFLQWKDTHSTTLIEEDATITVKARFIGHDDLLDEYKLDQTIIIN